MAKIDFSDGIVQSLNPAVYAKAETEKAKRRPLERPRRARFSSLLETAHEAAEAETAQEFPASEEALRELLDGIHSAGEALKRRPFPDEIKQYKRAARNFLHYILQNGYDVKEESYMLNHKKHIKVQVQVIDQKLEQLAAAVMSGQTTQLELLARVDEITGLLVNLLQ
jgi:uncharacterized protein YaaR (DUF327 family)